MHNKHLEILGQVLVTVEIATNRYRAFLISRGCIIRDVSKEEGCYPTRTDIPGASRKRNCSDPLILIA